MQPAQGAGVGGADQAGRLGAESARVGGVQVLVQGADPAGVAEEGPPAAAQTGVRAHAGRTVVGAGVAVGPVEPGGPLAPAPGVGAQADHDHVVGGGAARAGDCVRAGGAQSGAGCAPTWHAFTSYGPCRARASSAADAALEAGQAVRAGRAVAGLAGGVALIAADILGGAGLGIVARGADTVCAIEIEAGLTDYTG